MSFQQTIRDFFRKRKEKKAIEKRENEAVKMDPSHKPILIVICVVFAVYSLTLFFPLLWLFFNSLKDKVVFLNNPWQVGGKVLWSNYSTVFGAFNFGSMFFNSVTLVLTQPVVGLFSTTCAAYAVAKFRFKLRRLIYVVAISVMFIPTTGSLAVTYKLMFDSHLIDTLPGMIVMATGGFGFNFLLLYGMFKGILVVRGGGICRWRRKLAGVFADNDAARGAYTYRRAGARHDRYMERLYGTADVLFQPRNRGGGY